MGCSSASSTDLKEEKPILISDLQHEFDCDFNGMTLTLLQNYRIACHNEKNKIYIYSLNIAEKTWNLEISKTIEGNVGRIHYICELTNQKIASTYSSFSSLDNENENDNFQYHQINIVYIWKLSKENLLLLQKFDLATTSRYLTPISNGFVIFYPLNDIQLFIEKENTYENKTTLIDIVGYGVRSVLQLRNKTTIISSGIYEKNPQTNKSFFISFWEMETKEKKHSIMEVGVYSPQQMIELYDGTIAVSCSYDIQLNEQYSQKETFIVFINPLNFEIIRKVFFKDYISEGYELVPFDLFSLLAVKEGVIFQISTKNYSFMYTFSKKDDLFSCPILIIDRKYVIMKKYGSKLFSLYVIIQENTN